MNMQSDLELLVEYDMYDCGYDPSNQDHINAYWEKRLNGN